MKNPLKAYIDKRIEITLRRKEREVEEEKQRIEHINEKRKREEELCNRAKQYRNKLISDGECCVSTCRDEGYYGKNIPYEERDSTIVKNEIRRFIAEGIMKNLFTEKSKQYTDYTTFSLSEGLKQDLQKLHNIKPKENEQKI